MARIGSANCYKNITCLMAASMVLFVTSIFVAKAFYAQKVEDLVSQATLLTE